MNEQTDIYRSKPIVAMRKLVKIEEEDLEILRGIAEKEHRSMTKELTVIIGKYRVKA